MGRDRKKRQNRGWGHLLRRIRYDDEVSRLNDGKHQGARAPHGFLFVLRSNGYGIRKQSLEHLSATDFQREIALHQAPNGEWKPMCLYYPAFDPDYIQIRYDPTPEARRRWLAARGIVPPG